jgi:hypothetical protein
MPLLSALDDILVNTLMVIPGLLGRMEYLSGLRSGNSYGHWGLSRVHGERAAQQALTDAHELVLSEVLRTPLRRLVEDVETACVGSDRHPSAYLQELYRNYPRLLPEQVGGGSSRHFSSVLHALSALAAAAPLHATRPAA